VVAFDEPVSATLAALPPAPLILPEIVKACAVDEKFTPATFAPLTGTVVAEGANVYPDLLGVTV
jgi:hypothetical protein